MSFPYPSPPRDDDEYSADESAGDYEPMRIEVRLIRCSIELSVSLVVSTQCNIQPTRRCGLTLSLISLHLWNALQARTMLDSPVAATLDLAAVLASADETLADVVRLPLKTSIVL